MAELCNVGASTSAAAHHLPVEVDIPAPNFDILAERSMKVNQYFVIELQKEQNKNPTEKEQKSCKILKFLPAWTFEDFLKEISELDPKHYQSLFIFIINVKEVSEDEAEVALESMLEDAFNRFCKTRQIIIQLTSQHDKKTRIFYNDEKSLKVLQEIERDSNESSHFASFLRILLRMEPGTDETCEEIIINMLEQPNKLTLRLLTIFQQSPEFSFQIISHCAANFLKAHFLAALGLPFGDNEASLNQAQSRMICSVYEEQKYRSILEAALDNENSEVFEYLNCNHWFLIQRLPADHQIEIANKLVEEKKINKLCDLLEISETLFPTGIDLDSIKHERFEQIISQRRNFHAAVLSENYEEIDKFNKLRSDLKIIYSTDNKSAMFTALNNNKLDVCLYLKNKGLEGSDYKSLKNQLMNKNIEQSEIDPKNAFYILAARSRIHRNEGDQSKLIEQRQKIMSWFEAIQKTELGSPLINAAVQCDDLKIIFDFGRDDVAGVDLESADSDGIMYAKYKVIIIGAKYSTNEEEQKIKGTLAHELAHYVIGMVFGNDEQPYFNQSDERYPRYKEIVNKYKYLKNEDVDDGCEGIISLVYCYNESDYDAELIVRIFQILARFDDDPKKVEELKEKYSDLFEFGFGDVAPEMAKLNLGQVEFVKIFNDFSGLLPNICKKNLELSVSEVVKSLLDKNNLTVVTSNVPKLFLIETYNHLKELYGNLAGAKNIFVTQECLAKEEIWNHLKVLLERNQELTVLVELSGGIFENLKYFKGFFERCFVIVVPDENQSKEVARVLQKEGLKSEEIRIDYDWEKLANARSKLLQYEVNFQNNPKTPLQKLFENELSLSNIFDSKTLNKILDGQEIHVNIDIGLEESKKFELLYLDRELIKCEKRKEIFQDIEIEDDKNTSDEETDDEVSDDEESVAEEDIDEETEYEESDDKVIGANLVAEKNHAIVVDSEKKCEKPSKQGRFTKFWRNFSGIFQSCGRMFSKNQQTCSSSDEETDDGDSLLNFILKHKLSKDEDYWKFNKTEIKDKIEKTFVKTDKLFNAPIVLISDVAGSGKSWVMRNLAIELARSNSTNWVTFVDLKQFIPYFKECIRTKKDANFHAFIVEKVLQKNTKLELEIFKLKYGKGEAAIFLDGFDEIAPTCAEYVRKIIKTFDFSNQLFISTRDYFEVDLKKDLNVNFAYKLDELSDKNGKDLVARIWRLNDFENLENVELQRDIIDTNEYEDYLKSARTLIDTVKTSKYSEIGLPQVYSMIAKITKEEKSLNEELSIYQLYLKMYETIYEEWTTKNELRKEVNVRKQRSNLNFLKLHELKAMQRFKPEKSEYCDINPRYKWEEVLVDGCGILAKREKDFVFIHETFNEFFVAEFILRNLRGLETAAEAFKYTQEIIFGGAKRKIIRKFLIEGLKNEKNEASNEENIFDEIKSERVELLVKNVDKNMINSRNVCDIFVEELQDFGGIGDFLMEILQKSDFKLERIITEDLEKFISRSQTVDRDGKLEKLEKRLINFIKSSFDIQTLVNATNKLNEESLNCVKDSLRFKDEDCRNIFWKLAYEEVESEEKFEKFLAFLRNFLTLLEIADLMKERDKDGENIFEYWKIYENIPAFEVFFRGYKKFFETEFSLGDFKAFLMQKDKHERNIFINIFEMNDFIRADELVRFWNLLLETFENDTKGLFEIIFDQERFGRNCFQKLLNSICETDDVQLREIVCKIFKNLKDSKEFFSDFYGNNFLQNILCLRECNLSSNLKKLMETKVLSREEIKNLLSSLNKFGQNFLQFSSLFNIEFDMLKIFQGFFTSEQIVKFMKHRDVFGKNYLDICLMYNDEEVFEEKINEIIEEITKTGSIKEEQVERLKIAVKNKMSGCSNEEDLEILSLDWIQVGTSNETFEPTNPQELKELLLHENKNGENYFHQNLRYGCYTENYIQSILEKVEAELDAKSLNRLFNSTNKNDENLMQVLIRKKVSESFYEHLWKLWRESLDNETILNILKHKDIKGNNFLLTVAEFGTKEIVKITWRQIEEISQNQIIEMVKERTSDNVNILHLAADSKNCSLSIHLTEIGKYLKNLKEFVTEVTGNEKYPTILFRHTKCEDKNCHKALLNILLNCFENRDEFLKFLMRRESASFKSIFICKLIEDNKIGEIVVFVLETLKNVLNEDQFVEILMWKDKSDRNLLHFAFEKSKNIQTVEKIWKYYEDLKNFSEFIFEGDKYGRKNIIHYAAQHSTAEILDFLCEKLKNLNENENVKKTILGEFDLLFDAAWMNESKKSHESLWKLLHTFLNKRDILRMVNDKDSSCRNVLQEAVKWNTPEVVEFIWDQIKALITDENERNEYLRRKDKKGKSLRELAMESYSHSTEMVELVKNLKNM